jgi:hypothetical protein
MKLIIAGTRKFDDYEFLKLICDHIIEVNNLNVTEIISGKASGADRLGERYAFESEIKVTAFPAPWDDIQGKPESEIKVNKQGKKYWKLAGFHRNKQMLDYGDQLIVFWDLKSPGTKHMIDEAEKIKMMTYVVDTNVPNIQSN